MIARQIRGKSFRGLQNYLFSGRKGSGIDPERVAWVKTRNLPSDHPELAYRIMAATASQNRRVERPVLHVSINPPEGSELSRAQLRKIVDRTLEDVGLGDHQALVVAHHDLDRLHVHVMVNTVHPESLRVWNPLRNYRMVNRSLDRQAEALGLPRVARREHAAERANDFSDSLTTGAYRRAQARGREPFADAIRDQAREAMLGARSWEDLSERLGEHGLRVEAKGAGLVVTDSEEFAKASSVDRQASRGRLEGRFGETFAAFQERSQTAESPRTPSAPAKTRTDLVAASAKADDLLDRVTRRRATFTEGDLKRQAFWQKDRADRVKDALASDRVVPLGPVEQRGGAKVLHFTTRETLEAEARLLAVARALRADTVAPTVSVEAREAFLLTRGLEFSESERTAVRTLTDGGQLSLLSAGRGTERDRVLRAVASLYRESGQRLRAVAVSGLAAEELSKATGLPAETISSLERSSGKGRALAPGEVLMVDEASRLGTRRLGRWLEEAHRSGARVLLLGQEADTPPLGAGEAFNGLVRQFGAARLPTSPRQEIDWQSRATEGIQAGRVDRAVLDYHWNHRVEWLSSRGEAIEALAQQVRADSLAYPGESQLALAGRRADVERLNRAIRFLRSREGELGEGFRAGTREFAEGDRVIFQRNDPSGRKVQNRLPGANEGLGIRKGTFGTVTQVGVARFEARLDSGREVTFDPREYPHIDYGYAVNVRAARAFEADRVYILPHRSMGQAEAATALTRHTQDATLFVDQQAFRDSRVLAESLSHARPTDLVAAIDRERVEKLSRDFARELLEAAPTVPEPAAAAGQELVAASTRGEALVESINCHRAVFTGQDLERAARDEPQRAEVVRAALGSDELVALRQDSAGRTLYTTREYLRAETELFARARRLVRDRSGPRVPADRVEARLAEDAHRLSGEQAAAVRHLTSDGRLALLSGRSGSGKSRLLRETAEVFRAEGYRVRGAALAGTASEVLAESAGIEARTLASWEARWKRGLERLTDRDVLIFDEAGMVGTRQFGRVLAQVDEAGAKLIVTGDARQLRPIEAGEPFRGLLAEHPSAHLTEIRRQEVAWQREASAKFAAGRPAEALAAYREHGRIEWFDRRSEALSDLSLRYREDGRLHPQEIQLALANTRRDVETLNRSIRAARRAVGEIGPDVVIEGRVYAAGDRILFLENDHGGRSVRSVGAEDQARAGVKNGSFGTVTHASKTRFDVQLDTGRRVSFNPREYPAFRLGYAATVHKAQGATFDRVYLAPGRMTERDLAYVALTRHRRDLSLWVDRESFPTPRDLETRFSREPLKDLARDHRAVAELEELASQLERRQDIAQAIAQRSGETYRAGQALDEAARAKARETAFRKRLLAQFETVYRQPAEAEAKIAASISTQGAERTAARLEREPAAFGELRGRSRLRSSAERRMARATAPTAAKTLRAWAKERGFVLETGTRVERSTAGARQAVHAAREAANVGRALASLRLEHLGRVPGQALAGTARILPSRSLSLAVTGGRSVKLLARELSTLPSDEAAAKIVERSVKTVGWAAAAQSLPTPAFLLVVATHSTWNLVRKGERKRDAAKSLGTSI